MTLYPDKFDVMIYLLRNKDVLVAGIDPYKHYVEYGSAEGRKFDWGLVPINSETKNVTKNLLLRKIHTFFSRIRHGAVKIQRNK